MAERTSAIAGLLFDGADKRAWAANQSAAPTRVQEVPDPTGAIGTVLRFTTYDGDIAPRTPTANPRSQLVTATNLIREGRPFWESFEVYLPRTFPVSQTDGGWVALEAPVYGSPFRGTPAIELEIKNGDFLWQTNANAPIPWEQLWTAPVTLGRWLRFTWYIIPSRDGFAELYYNDQPVRVEQHGRDSFGLALPVIDRSDQDGPWSSRLSVYYRAGEFAHVTVYFRDFRIATTRRAAETMPVMS